MFLPGRKSNVGFLRRPTAQNAERSEVAERPEPDRRGSLTISAQIISVLRTAAFLAACLIATSTAFVLLTYDSLRSSVVDQAAAAMETLLDDFAARMGSYERELPVRLLTNPTQSPFPPNPLPRDYAGFMGTRDVPELDPWGRSYLLIADDYGARLRLTCISPGPNGRFETTQSDDAAINDDIRLQRQTQHAPR